MHYCEGAECRGNKEISGRMSHRFWSIGEESKTAVFPNVLKGDVYWGVVEVFIGH